MASVTENIDAEGVKPPAGQDQRIVIRKPRVEVVVAEIKGNRPLLVHAWSAKAKRMMLEAQSVRQGDPAAKGKGKKGAREPKNPEDDFNGSRYISTEGWDGVPSVAFKAAMVGACRQVEGVTMSLAKRLIFVESDGMTADNVDLVRIVGEPRMHEGMVRVGSGLNKTADIRYRALYWPWSATVRIRFNANMVSPDAIFNLLMIAGISEGICDWRPSAPQVDTGNYGTWDVVEGQHG